MNTKRMLVAVGAAAATLVVVVGCSDDTGKDTTTATTAVTTSAASGTNEQGGAHNDADVAYVQMMIPHHEQAVEMAELVPSRSGNPDVVALAAQIEKAQGPEIEQMEGWLKAWGVGMEHGEMSSMPGMSAQAGGHEGMMTDEQMQALENAEGADFDRMWLEMMIEHHQGAVASSEQILGTGESEQVRQLAQQIVASQQAEITQMQDLLNK